MARKKTKKKSQNIQAISLSTRKLANEILANGVQLADIRQMSGAFSHDLQQERPLPSHVEMNIEMQGLKIPGEQPLISAEIKFNVCASFEPDSPQCGTMQISAAFAIGYKVDSLKGLNEENISAFVSCTAIIHVWPYMREFLQSTTTRMGFPGMKLPLLMPVQIDELDPSEKARQTPSKTNSGKKKATKKGRRKS